MHVFLFFTKQISMVAKTFVFSYSFFVVLGSSVYNAGLEEERTSSGSVGGRSSSLCKAGCVVPQLQALAISPQDGFAGVPA